MAERQDPPLTGSEVATLRGFLDFYRATIRLQASGLTSEQLATTLEPSDLTLGGMLKHLAYVEHHWFVRSVSGHQSHWMRTEFEQDGDWDWHSAATDSPDQLFAWYDDAVAESDQILEAALDAGDLDQQTKGPGYAGRPTSLRWVLTHLVEEYARHAGHADLIRQSIDGAVDV